MTRCRHRHLNVQRRYVGQVDFISLLRQPTRRSEEHTSELQSQSNLVCRLLLEKKKKKQPQHMHLSLTHTTTYTGTNSQLSPVQTTLFTSTHHQYCTSCRSVSDAIATS